MRRPLGCHRKFLRNPLSLRLGEPDIRSERFGVQICFAGIRTPDHPAHSMYHILIHNILSVSSITLTCIFIQSDTLKLLWELQYSETNVMHFLFNLLRIKGLYMFRALLAPPQEALHKRHLVYCVRVMSFGCCTRTGVELVSETPVPLQSWYSSQLT
jgi:hypothetical protein